jgi:NodT family efflux transporter outer membrane factor (OMF) lipoprotein
MSRRRGPGPAAITLAVIIALASGCTVGPRYVRPTVAVPTDYKELGWKVAQPQDDVLRGEWWTRFGDPTLDALAVQVGTANQTLAAAEATYREASALVREARSAYFPTVTAGVGYTRSRSSANLGNLSTGVVPTGPRSDFLLPLDVTWEPDFWGRVRRTVEASQAGAQASAGDLATARLSLEGELALDYFQLRALDAQRRLLDETTAAYARALELTQTRHASGVASGVDVVQAETQWKTTQAQAIDVGVQRAQLEHAIAVLVGQPASTFSLPVAPLDGTPPAIPVGVPSELLERRPDIAAAERRVAAANAQIGVAEAAYYPTVTLGLSAGLESGSLAQWLAWPSRFWSVGPAISQTVFDGGLRRAQTEQARAAYDATVAAYRQTVLAAFQAVEDNLAALKILAEEADVQDEAVAAATRSVALTTSQYRSGTVSYLNVIVTQTIELTNRVTQVQILGRRMTAAVQLIQALGGGWSIADLPSAHPVTNIETTTTGR